MVYFCEATELTGREASEIVSTLEVPGKVLTPSVPPDVEETCPS
jgi:hypothetical protein